MLEPVSDPTTSPDMERVEKTKEEWKKILTPEQYRILRQHGTERAGTGPHLNEKRSGTFLCAGCGNPLYRSDAKFESGTGWPSFYEAINGSVTEHDDRSFFMRRTEVRCAKCEGHLGHVFPDGPHPTGLRYCMNGHAMTFTPDEEK